MLKLYRKETEFVFLFIKNQKVVNWCSLKNNASKMMDRILTSNVAKKAVNSMDDIDNMGPFGRRYYENLMKEEKISIGSSGVEIRKAEVVNGAGDLEEIVREGGSEGLDNVKKFMYDADGNYTGGRIKAELNALEYDPAKKCVTVGAQNEAKIGLDLEKRNYRKILKGVLIPEPNLLIRLQERNMMSRVLNQPLWGKTESL